MRVRIVGAGFSGAVAARVLADAGCTVEVWEKRSHVGGNAYECDDAHGVRVHPYGPHIFHTQSQRVLDWLSRFTEWRAYEHRVVAQVDGQFVPMPINRTTLNRLYGLNLDEAGAAAFLEAVREPHAQPRNSEEAVLSYVGRDLCDKLYRGYTFKQWGCDLSALSASVVNRIPVRTNDDDRYFSDTFQCMPLHGYTALFDNMLSHPQIALSLNRAFDPERVQDRDGCDYLIYTGPVDAFFKHCHGALPYRSLRFEQVHVPDVAQVLPATVVNYPNDHAYTRETEWKQLTGQQCQGTTLTREYPCAEGEPFYPVPNEENQALLRQYQTMAEGLDRVAFIGRLAEYRYYNMDQAVASALSKATAIAHRLGLLNEVSDAAN
jgi:UDP-galactopyranose mutase